MLSQILSVIHDNIKCWKRPQCSRTQHSKTISKQRHFRQRSEYSKTPSNPVISKLCYFGYIQDYHNLKTAIWEVNRLNQCISADSVRNLIRCSLHSKILKSMSLLIYQNIFTDKYGLVRNASEGQSVWHYKLWGFEYTPNLYHSYKSVEKGWLTCYNLHLSAMFACSGSTTSSSSNSSRCVCECLRMAQTFINGQSKRKCPEGTMFK